MWDTTPDAELLEAAQKRRAQHRGGLDKQVDRLMASPRLEAGMRAFFNDMLELDTFDTVSKDTHPLSQMERGDRRLGQGRDAAHHHRPGAARQWRHARPDDHAQDLSSTAPWRRSIDCPSPSTATGCRMNFRRMRAAAAS